MDGQIQSAVMTTTPQSRLAYPVNEAAQLLGISRSTLYGLIGAGDVHAVKIGGRTLVTAAELDRYLAEITKVQTA